MAVSFLAQVQEMHQHRSSLLQTLIVGLAARLHLPAVYSYRFLSRVADWSRIYGKDLWPAAAVNADRILRGEKPGDLPVQLPTKYYLMINLRQRKPRASRYPCNSSSAPTK
jgi:putative ABC transport system substrate-binding protein